MIFPGVERASSEQSGKKNVENVESSERASEASRGELETFSTFFFPLCSRDALSTPGKITCALASHKTYIASLAENEFKYSNFNIDVEEIQSLNVEVTCISSDLSHGGKTLISIA